MLLDHLHHLLLRHVRNDRYALAVVAAAPLRHLLVDRGRPTPFLAASRLPLRETLLAVLQQNVRSQIRGHDDHRVREVHGASLLVRQTTIVEHLQEQVPHVRMRLLHLVQQNHVVRTSADRLRELTALLVAHVAGRSAHQPRHRVLLHVLRHVDAHDVLLVVEQLQRQLLRRVAGDQTLRALDDVHEFLAVAKEILFLLLQLSMRTTKKTCLRDLLPHVHQVAHLVVQVLLLHLQTTQLRLKRLVVAIYMLNTQHSH